MICRHCGTEIAEKALICYKCGNATTEPRVAPPARSRRKGSPLTLVALLVLMLLALLFAWRFGLIVP